MSNKPPRKFWNYRVVAEYYWSPKAILRGWTFTIRGVHYEDHGKRIVGWDADPMHPLGDESVRSLKDDINLMRKAYSKPLLIRKANADELIEHGYGHCMDVTTDMLSEYEDAPSTYQPLSPDTIKLCNRVAEDLES